jgi:glycosyltransferase involved in cell wall biosynthesis
MLVDIINPWTIPGSYGGVRNATFSLACELRSKCDITVHTFNVARYPPKKFRYISDGLPKVESIHGIRTVRYPSFSFPIVNMFTPSLLRAVKSSNSNIVHIQGVALPFLGFSLQRYMPEKKFVLTCHTLHESLTTLDELPAKSLFKKTFARTYLDRFDRIIALSNIDRNALLNIGYPNDCIRVISNGIDIDKLTKKETFVTDHPLDVLCVARFDTNKGYENLILALKQIKRAYSFKAYFVGSIVNTAYFRGITNMIKALGLERDIKLLTSITNPQLADCYSAAKIFVLPSSMETFPIAIMEAMYSGLPVVATKVGGIPDLIKNGVNGLLVNPADPKDLARAILVMMENKNVAKSIGNRNRELAADFSWKKVAEKTLALYQELDS